MKGGLLVLLVAFFSIDMFEDELRLNKVREGKSGESTYKGMR